MENCQRRMGYTKRGLIDRFDFQSIHVDDGMNEGSGIAMKAILATYGTGVKVGNLRFAQKEAF